MHVKDVERVNELGREGYHDRDLAEICSTFNILPTWRRLKSDHGLLIIGLTTTNTTLLYEGTFTREGNKNKPFYLEHDDDHEWISICRHKFRLLPTEYSVATRTARSRRIPERTMISGAKRLLTNESEYGLECWRSSFVGSVS